MTRALLLASLFLVGSSAAHGQALSVLHIKVVVIDSERKVTPVARHVLLVSDNPPSAPPRAIVTRPDGTADVRLRPGNYTVESERPVAFQGRVYEWTQRLDIAAGLDAVLELTADNANVEPVASAATTTAASPLETDPSFLLPQWQGSVVALWTPTTHASGFLVDATGLIATNQRVIGTATMVEVQLTPEAKVMARVLAADPVRDVAVLWIDPAAAASVRPVPLGCSQAARPSVVEGQELFTIGTPLREPKGMTSGTVSRVEPRSIVADFRLAPGSAGGPVFTAGGGVVGITSVAADDDESRRWASRIVRIDDVCDVVASAEKKMQGVPPPNGTLLPVEPVRLFPVDALKGAAQRLAGSLSPSQMSSSDFDIAFITPVLIYGAQSQSEQGQGRERSRDPGTLSAAADVLRPLRDFSNWSEYVAEFPPVLLIRVTPRLVERFWTTVARGAARTQGVSLPPIKHFKAGFSRMRAFCGDAEVTPIHPFKLEQRTSETDAIYEGLYVFDPAALGPHCGTVKLVLYSEKEPEKGDTRVVDPRVLQRIWQDFAPYRAQGEALATRSGGIAAEIKVLSTQGVEGAYRELVPQFEKASGHKVTTIFTGTIDAQRRIAAGETYDLIIMAAPAIDDLITSGRIAPGSRVDLARSGVGVAVRAGAPKPDIHSVEALKKTLLAATSIGYSTGPSGVYLADLFRTLGIADQITSKLKQTPTGVFVGSIIASGQVEIGFQQVSELSDYPGIDYVGPLPAEIQNVTVFSSGMQIGATAVEAARAWITFLTSPAAAAVFRSKSMDPGGVRGAI